MATLRSDPGVVVGFAALSPYKERAAYRTTVENSVYVSREHGGLGIGTALMLHVIDVARESGFHSIVARIEASSEASRGLHASVGFELVGVEREVGPQVQPLARRRDHAIDALSTSRGFSANFREDVDSARPFVVDGVGSYAGRSPDRR